MRNLRSLRAATLAAVLVLCGCGGSNDDGDPGTCEVASDLGDLGARTGTAGSFGTEFIVWSDELNQDSTPDVIVVQLYDGFGVFSGGITTGTFTISGEELQLATCGVCVLLAGDVDTGTGESAANYLATGGTVTLTSVAGQMTGSLSNVTFHEVTIDPNTFVSTPVGSCTSSVTAASFDATIQAL